MSTTNSNLSFINVSQRAYKYIRQFSIKDCTDAIVELVTNCDDAYNRSQAATIATGNTAPRPIYITYNSNTNVLNVTDNAGGLTSSELSSCFLQVGNYTSTDGSRGFFSRGAKDVSILGNVYFDSIKNGAYSQCTINTEAEGGILVADEPVHVSQSVPLGLTDKVSPSIGGLSVTLNLLPPYRITNINQFIYDITKRAQTRNIFSDPNTNIIFNHYDYNNNLAISKQLSYTYPTSSVILSDIIFEVPNNPGVNARFTTYRSAKPIDQPQRENQMEFGYLIKSGSSVHEVSTLDSRFRWHPCMPLLYGTLQCDYIDQLMSDMETKGATAENPNTIIDPSRFTGLNRDHPFVKNLLQIPLTRLDYELRNLDGTISRNSIQLTDFNDLLQQIEDYGVNLFNTIPTQSQFNESYDSQLVKAIQSDRQQYVILERNFSYPTNDLAIDGASIPSQISQLSLNSTTPTNYVYLLNDYGDVVPIDTGGINLTSPDLTESDLQQFYADLMNNIDLSAVTTNPYIYSLSDTGDVQKMYIFSHGSLATLTAGEQRIVNTNQKILSINFTSDINATSRYTIDSTGGPTVVNINLNDPIISNYFLGHPHGLTTQDKINALKTTEQMSTGNISNMTTSLNTFGSSKCYLFMSELFTDIFSRIILGAQAQTGQLVLDSDSTFNNLAKSRAELDKIISQIQIPIHQIFNTYYQNNLTSLAQVIIKGILTTAEQESIIVAPTPSQIRPPFAIQPTTAEAAEFSAALEKLQLSVPDKVDATTVTPGVYISYANLKPIVAGTLINLFSSPTSSS